MAQVTTPIPTKQAITGLTPPTSGEARVREEWPTVMGVSAAAASLARACMQSIVLLPLGWLILAPLFKLKFAPFLCKRYTLTNRRLMIRRGWKPAVVQEVALADIDDVRLAGDVDAFFLSGDLEVVSKGSVVMRLPASPEPEGFRQAILNTVVAWVPGRTQGHFQPASAVKSEAVKPAAAPKPAASEAVKPAGAVKPEPK
jgi:hypothetical protein